MRRNSTYPILIRMSNYGCDLADRYSGNICSVTRFLIFYYILMVA